MFPRFCRGWSHVWRFCWEAHWGSDIWKELEIFAVLRWLQWGCRVCCWYCLQSRTICLSSETSKVHTPALACLDTGYSLYILTFHRHFLSYTDFLLIPTVCLQNWFIKSLKEALMLSIYLIQILWNIITNFKLLFYILTYFKIYFFSCDGKAEFSAQFLQPLVSHP